MSLNRHNTGTIVLQNISKKYYLEKPRTLKKWVSGFFSPFGKFVVINNLSLSVSRGDFVLVTGPNGSGKTTLLKLIAGITKPDSGSVLTKGKVVPLIELGAGFNYELTGRENIWINGTILGIDRDIIKKITPKIIQFSGIDNFIDIPIKRYSSGMVSRLAFSIAVYAKPDILLLDEVFAVGDKQFRDKSIKVLRGLRKKGVTIILSSNYIYKLSWFNKRIHLKNNDAI